MNLTYILLQTPAFSPAERLWALEPAFQCGATRGGKNANLPLPRKALSLLGAWFSSRPPRSFWLFARGPPPLVPAQLTAPVEYYQKYSFWTHLCDQNIFFQKIVIYIRDICDIELKKPYPVYKHGSATSMKLFSWNCSCPRKFSRFFVIFAKTKFCKHL